MWTRVGDWVKKMLLEKWAGRAIEFALVALSTYLARYLPAGVTDNLVDALRAALEAGVPLILAWLLGMARVKTALLKMPPQIG